ncbi:ATP-binding cassette, subfamily C, CydD [Desulfonispora thiosulfatigenes DSM 11270]|uniref:ATP-binding cassette, subfamily C, CydD n=1 Tax=Desulfonispora thiosulfatigenes DSM 11270 TaxID=656914 RepID=A0A1W1UFS6_DESTI|nr:thiol reductant ABC exporter subunit CydD [Desulfonispora thiosulfatigenes]SMB79920.1 ATP-binding cassette, subfamily C, CydD [Desulfonispora thiosulfatigenes DSM 11270]
MINRNLISEIQKTPRLFFVSVFLSVFSAFLLLWEYWLIAKIIQNAFLDNIGIKVLKPIFIQAVVVLTLRMITDYFDDLYAQKLVGVIQKNVRSRIIQKVALLGPSYMEKKQSGAMLSMLLDGVDTLETYFRSYLPQLIKSLLIPTLFLLVVSPLDYIASVIFFLTLPLIPFFMILIGKWTKNASERQWRLITQLSGYLQDVLRGLETLVVLGRSEEQGNKIEAISEAYRVSTLRVQRWAFISSLALELIATISIALVAVSLGLRLVSGEMNYQIALFTLLLAPEYYKPMRSLGSYFHVSLDAEAAATDIYAFLNVSEELTLKIKDESFSFSDLTFENVSYRYPETKVYAVQDINFRLKAGESLAMVGQSGSGKSTIMQLALGLIKPTKGRILINGKDMHDGQIGHWQSRISYVPQKPYLFGMSISENIAMEANLDQTKKKRIEKLAQETGLSESILNCPQGLDTLVGQGGIELSGGQQELLYLTRAFYEAREILFLDEVTDNLDIISEQNVINALNNLLRKKTSLIIAHRLTTVEQVDRILVFHEGHLVEQGKPGQLKAQKNYYYNLVKGENS